MSQIVLKLLHILNTLLLYIHSHEFQVKFKIYHVLAVNWYI